MSRPRRPLQNRLKDVLDKSSFEALVRVRAELEEEEVERAAVEYETPPEHGEDYEAFRILRAEPDRRYALGVAWHADRADTTPAASGHRDYISADVLERTAWEWMKVSRQIGLLHLDGTEGHADVVESYIYRPDDPWVMRAIDGSEQTVRKGDWLVGVIFDEATWPAVKRQQLDGFSPDGKARRRVVQ